MPKIIFTSRYLRDAPPAQMENYVRYVSTREGVEKVEGSRQNLPATAQQKDLVRQILRDIPSAKEMLEYTDFLLRPTMGNASEFISCALEQNMDLIGSRENYVDYIANRPRVERLGEHGLFTDAGKSTVASAEIEKMVVRLAERLQNTGGKKVYGYLKRDVKNLVDRIVDELAKEEKVDALYRA